MTEPEPTERTFAALPQPEKEDNPALERRGRRGLFELPEGAFGFFVLLVLAAVSGGLISAYWPWVAGNSDMSAVDERVAALETRIGQIASGKAPQAAAATFKDLRGDMSALSDRIDADEARIMALEKSSGDAGDTTTSIHDRSGNESASNLAAIVTRLDRLEQSANAKLGARMDAADKLRLDLRNDIDARMTQLAEQQSKLGTRLDALELNAPPADLAQRLDSFAARTTADALDVRLTRLENQDVEGVMRRAASVLALANLIRATRGPEPFEAELRALKPLAGNSPQIADLARHARGVPTIAMLEERLEQLAPSILAASRKAETRNWLERLWANITSLVSVRRIDAGAGKDVESRIARAQKLLRTGELARANAEIKALPMEARRAAQNWIADADARLDIEQDTASLTTEIVGALAPVPEPVTP
ncbi:MAG: hypothetical protein GC166_02960 [Alphaproteobacteria bacterium]|nr:hypothetical protein [Alphaproteobacteria bacterium]